MSKNSNDASLHGIDKPIICKAYEEPSEHWHRDRKTGVPQRVEERRPAGFWEPDPNAEGCAIEEIHREFPLVNKLRDDVRQWRNDGYPRVSHVTKDLLAHWTSEEREYPLFFCQREAVETIIYLAEVRIPQKPQHAGKHEFSLSALDLEKLLAGETSLSQKEGEYRQTLLDRQDEKSLQGLRRFGCKMATGSGKTLVMAMLIIWALCNRARSSKESIFPGAVLICCPNKIVKERLDVLRPYTQGNCYSEFDLIPPGYSLPRERVRILNWHTLMPASSHKEGGHEFKIINKGREPDEVFTRRILGNLLKHKPLMVLNDEGHHCWRPKFDSSDTTTLSGEELKNFKEERERGTVWIQGLDRINNQNEGGGISFCVDMSATPFYIQGSGHADGKPFPWLVSDFGLMDAIESGIVKIPRIPIRDTSGKHLGAKYFKLWENHIRGRAKKTPAPNVIYKRANGALMQVVSQWVQRFEQNHERDKGQSNASPVMIVVCSDMKVAQMFHSKISGEQKGKGGVEYLGSEVSKYLSNTKEHKYTIRIDSDTLAEAGKEEGEALRKMVSTVGKKGEPGEQVRCVISVSMLTEGWDASNVTQILGIRAFGRQLICEQVVGRGLRKMNYEPDPDRAGFLVPDYVDVYGIPFSVIPYKGQTTDQVKPDIRLRTHICSLEARQHMEMRFPIVDGYLFQLKKNLITCDVDSLEPLKIDPDNEPIVTFVQPPKDDGGPPTWDDSLNTEKQDRQKFYDGTHIKAIMFRLAQYIVRDLVLYSIKDNGEQNWGAISRHQLFPRVLKIVKEYVEKKVEFNGINRCELGIECYFDDARRSLLSGIRPDESEGEDPLLPILRKERAIGSTKDVNFTTVRECFSTTHSHINEVAIDSEWEKEAAKILEKTASEGLIEYYARIYERMGLAILYEKDDDAYHRYIPDFLVRMPNPDGGSWTLILEIKGFKKKEDGAKHDAADRWVAAVNNWGKLGKWGFYVCRNPNELAKELKEQYKKGPNT